MKILVCVKQVIESESTIRIDDSARGILTDKSTCFRMNRFDESAVEEAVLIKETFPDTTVDVITVGPSRSAMVVKRALGMGADHGIHITTEHEGHLSPSVISFWIASYARNKNYKLILTGIMSEDDMQGQVGPMAAEFLSLPCATSTIFERISPEKGTVYVEREMESGLRDTLEIKLPALLTIQTGINSPRYPSLSNMLRAKKQEMEIIDAKTLERPGHLQDVIRMAYPQRRRSGVTITGTLQEQAHRLFQLLSEKSFIR